MKKEKINRSPLFYVGDKYKLIKEIKTHFPKTINQLIEPFVGGGSVYLNVKAERYLLNDIDKNVIKIHNFLCSFIGKENEFYDLIFSIIRKYNLSFSYEKDIVPNELKEQYKKTYYAYFNKESFNKLKSDYNQSNERDVAVLYVLLIYGFNRMLRFNSQGDYNLPVGNVDFNQNVFNALADYFRLNKIKQPNWHNLDFKVFLNSIDYQENDLVYLDPPYLITFSEYNKLWNEQTEKDLLQMIDNLNKKNIKFAISNVTHYKGKENNFFIDWAKQYNSYQIKSNYISYHDNSKKVFNEVLVTNYKPEIFVPQQKQFNFKE
ncbi:MAG TPA: Dam family site-specific DNA-(adenine-N6)-methyltransferase [Bacteroidales bacterium]|jgi:DNA adenine methylase|nr:Dam family site-specific DNA-(adenine-N6)-methyltransferase [Bacteroidales bacterium]